MAFTFKCIILLALFYHPLFAKVKIERPKDLDEKPGELNVAKGGRGPAIVTIIEEDKGCSEKNTSNILPFELISGLIYSGDIDIKLDEDGRGTINIPKYFSACMDLELNVSIVDSTLFIRGKNNYDMTKYSGDTFNEKYELCLKEKGLTDENGIVPISEVEDNLKTKTVSFTAVLPENFDEDVYVAWGSPKVAKGYETLFSSIGVGKTPEDWHCLTYETPKKDGYRVMTSEITTIKERAIYNCNRGRTDKLLIEINSLKNRKDLGNVDALVDSMTDVLIKSLEKKSNSYMKNLTTLQDKIKNASNEATANDSLAKYHSIVAELNDYVYRPAIELSSKIIDDSDVDDRKVLDLKNVLSGYSAINKGEIYSTIKKFGLFNYADKIEEVRLTSSYHGAVNSHKGGSLSHDRAKKEIVRKLSIFTRDIKTHWSNDYLTKTGDKSPVLAQQQKISRTNKLLNDLSEKYKKNINNEYKRNCTSLGGAMKHENTKKCQSWYRERAPILARAYEANKTRYLKNLSRLSVQLQGYEENLLAYSQSNDPISNVVPGYYDEFSVYDDAMIYDDGSINYDNFIVPINYGQQPIIQQSQNNPAPITNNPNPAAFNLQ